MKKQALISMTGYGKAMLTLANSNYECQVRTVNSRFLDLQIKLSKDISHNESVLRTLLAKYFTRGRVELIVSKLDSSERKKLPSLDSDLFKLLTKEYRKLADVAKLKISDEQIFARVLETPELISFTEASQTVITETQVVKLASIAIDKALKMRVAEGKILLTVLLKCVQQLKVSNKKLTQLAKLEKPAIEKRLKTKILQMLTAQQFDEHRFASEVAYLIERVDVAEELARIDSHLQQLEAALNTKLDGKTLEFIIQELSREFNTLNAKSQNVDIANLVINARSVLEKLREQAQNIE